MIKTQPLAATACGLLALACTTTQAQISLETFSGYTPGTLLKNNTPSPTVAGYTGNWTGIDWGNQSAGTLAGSLSYGGAGYAAGTGDHIGVPNAAFDWANSGRVYRLLDSSLTVNSSTSGILYLSWLFQSGQETGATTYQMLDLYDVNTADGNRNFTAGLTGNGGNTGLQYDFGVDEAYTSTGVASDTGVHLFVVKFDFSATALSDSVTVWIDPTLGAGDPTGGLTVSGKDITFDRLAISDYDDNSANWDEIRWGASFDSVTIAPVPEPSTLALGGIGLAALMIFRRKAQA